MQQKKIINEQCSMLIKIHTVPLIENWMLKIERSSVPCSLQQKYRAG